MKRALFLCGLILFSGIFLAPRAESGRLTPALQSRAAQLSSTATIPVIIHFTGRVDPSAFGRRSDHRAARAEMLHALKDKADRSQGALRAYLNRQGVTTQQLWIVNALASNVPVSELDTLAAWPGVDTVAVDYEIPPPAPLPLAVPPLAPPTWNIAVTGAPTLWGGNIFGTGVTVAVLDTGVNPYHPDLGPAYKGDLINDHLSGEWHDPYNGTTVPSDFSSGGLTHGTAVASVILGGENSGNAIGMAPGAQWIAARIFPPNGPSTTAGIHAAMQWALNPDGNDLTDDAPDVVNNSWGFEANTNECIFEYQDDIALLQAFGIHVIYAAGNTGPDPATSISPANNPEGFAAGSIGPSLQVSPISARGPSPCGESIYTPFNGVEVFPELLAPGDAIPAANGTSNLADYALVAGTSLAAPHVSGALALLRQAFPLGSLSLPMVDHRLALEMALLDTADDLGPLGPDNTYGHGLLNVDAAYLRLNGQPHLALHTPGAPENDTLVDFGNLIPGNSSILNLTLKNTGGATLNLISIQTSDIAPPFTVASNDCPGTLPIDASCTLSLGFAPENLGSFNGQLTVQSSDPRRPNLAVTLKGYGNNLPPVPLLISPADQAKVPASPVTFTWFQGPDPDGDLLTQQLVWSDNSLFIDEFSLTVAVNRPTGNLLIAGSLLLLCGLALRRQRGVLLLVLFAGLLYLVSACSSNSGSSTPINGGGGSEPGDLPPVANNSYTLTTLSPGITYYWKIRTDDGHGGVIESSVRSFTTL